VTWVADASAIVAYLLGEGSEAEREAMLGDLNAPALVDVEATQTLRRLLRGGQIDLHPPFSGRAAAWAVLGAAGRLHHLSAAWTARWRSS
jgi:predicted nucleic acid-binding protein